MSLLLYLRGSRRAPPSLPAGGPGRPRVRHGAGTVTPSIATLAAPLTIFPRRAGVRIGQPPAPVRGPETVGYTPATDATPQTTSPRFDLGRRPRRRRLHVPARAAGGRRRPDDHPVRRRRGRPSPVARPAPRQAAGLGGPAVRRRPARRRPTPRRPASCSGTTTPPTSARRGRRRWKDEAITVGDHTLQLKAAALRHEAEGRLEPLHLPPRRRRRPASGERPAVGKPDQAVPAEGQPLHRPAGPDEQLEPLARAAHRRPVRPADRGRDRPRRA